MRMLTLFTDGGSRGNPGPAALGAVLYDEDGVEVDGVGEYLGTATNNVAEYSALIRGLEMAREQHADKVAVHMDSELIVKQMTGVYRVKHKDMKPLAAAVKELEGQFERVTYTHVPREENKEADRLVNEALDAQLS